jgi:hypothetical protein
MLHNRNRYNEKPFAPWAKCCTHVVYGSCIMLHVWTATKEGRMGRLPKPAAPHARHYPHLPTPAPADYSDEVTEKDLKALKELVREESESEEWVVIDGPGW